MATTGPTNRWIDKEGFSEWKRAEIDEINVMRKSAKLSQVRVVERRCLRCKCLFTSYGFGHRMCTNCRKLELD